MVVEMAQRATTYVWKPSSQYMGKSSGPCNRSNVCLRAPALVSLGHMA